MKKIFAVLAVILISASWSFAADDVFSIIDKDKDGRISKQEYLDAMAGAFDKQDKNHDGVLTRDGLPNVDKKELEKFVKETDTDNDGKILKKEYQVAAEKRFSSLDKNKDGYISKKEWLDGRFNKSPMFVLFRF